jgi:copper chaperone NosL
MSFERDNFKNLFVNLKKSSQNLLGRLFYILFLVSIILHCGRNEPSPIAKNEEKCEHCYMKIVDMRFDSQLITSKGKRYYFDSIECMGYYTKRNQDELEKLWVKDFLGSGAYIEAGKAYFLNSEKIPSPMGAYLSAFLNPAARETVQKDFSGNLLDWNEVLEYLDERRK